MRPRRKRENGKGLHLLGFQRLNWGDAFPFSVPAIANIEQLRLGASVTLLAGENGSGKSAIREAIAAAIGFAEYGGELSRLGELPAVPRNVVEDLRAPLLAPVLSATEPRNGDFLRAESFFNVAEFVDRGDRFAPDPSLSVLLAALAAQIYELDEEGIISAVYDDLQAVRQMRGFLDAPDRYLRQIMIDPEAGDR